MANFNVIHYGGEGGEFKFVFGRKVYFGTDDNDAMIGGTGKNVMNAGEGEDLLRAGAGNDMLNGGSGDDTLYGGLGEDALLGVNGSDTFIGGEDALLGVNGSDTFIGGADADRFILGAGDDVIEDYNSSEGDKIGIAFLTNYRFEQIEGDVKVFSDQGETTIKNTELDELTVINKGQIVDLSQVN